MSDVFAEDIRLETGKTLTKILKIRENSGEKNTTRMERKTKISTK